MKSLKNMNEVTRAVALLEGKKVSLSIAQVKEVLRVLRHLVSEDEVTYYTVLKYLKQTQG